MRTILKTRPLPVQSLLEYQRASCGDRICHRGELGCSESDTQRRYQVEKWGTILHAEKMRGKTQVEHKRTLERELDFNALKLQAVEQTGVRSETAVNGWRWLSALSNIPEYFGMAKSR